MAIFFGKISKIFTKFSSKMPRFDWAQRALSAYFRLHIRFVLRHPAPFVLVPLLATALLGIGLLWLPDALVKVQRMNPKFGNAR